MIRLFWISLFLCYSLIQLHAEEEETVHVIEIRYEVFVENTDSLNSYKYNLPYETFHVVSPDRVITLNKYAADVDEIHIYDLENRLDYQCFFQNKNDKVAVKSPIQQVGTLLSKEDGLEDYQVGGMLCKKYDFLHKDSKVEIYTTDSFGVDFSPFSQVKGYAMQYTFVDEVYGKVTYVAKSIYPTVVNKSTFSLDEYRVTDEIYAEDFRGSFDKVLIKQESSSLFKLNKKTLGYNFKLTDKTKVNEESNPDSLVVMAISGFQKLSPLDKDLMSSMIEGVSDKKVKFYFFAFKNEYSKKELQEVESLGFDAAYLRDFFLTKFKIQYYPTYILMDKNRKVIKYKIGTNRDMITGFTEKIIELSDK